MQLIDLFLLLIVAGLTYFYFLPKQSTTPKPKKITPKTKPLDHSDSSQLMIFYGSQTGTSENFSKRFSKQIQSVIPTLLVSVYDLEDCDYHDIINCSNNTLILFFVSTYGEGEPTDGAVGFYDWILQGRGKLDDDASDLEPNPDLSHLNYCVFGLGNKTYEFYNAIATRLDAFLKKSGANRVLELGLGDDNANMEDDYSKWNRDAIPLIATFFNLEIKRPEYIPLYEINVLDVIDNQDIYNGELGVKGNTVYDMKNPYYSNILSKKQLFNDSKDEFKFQKNLLVPSNEKNITFNQTTDTTTMTVQRECYHVEINLEGTGLTYNAGDHIGIWPTNDPSQVNRLAGLIPNIPPLDNIIKVIANPNNPHSETAPFPNPSSIRNIFAHYLDITAPIRQDVFYILSRYSSYSEQLIKYYDDRTLYSLDIEKPRKNLLDLIEEFDIKLPFSVVIEIVPRLSLRYYSISSTPLGSHSVSITAAVVCYGIESKFQGKHHLSVRKGVCTSWIQRESTTTIPFYIRHSSFKLAPPSVPIIMIGPGTGVAPFRGFILEREHAFNQGQTISQTLLFFGCRHPEQDSLYIDEFSQLICPTIKIHTAYSRFHNQKVYVQHLIKEQQESIKNLVNNNAIIYVCGDGKYMALDVHDVFCLILGKDVVKSMKNQHRYLEDVWT